MVQRQVPRPAEVVRTMKLLGVHSLAELTPRHVTQLVRLAPLRRESYPG